MSTGFCYSLLLITRFEVQGVGLQWNNINESPLVNDPISVLYTFFIVFIDGILYFIIGFIINNMRFGKLIVELHNFIIFVVWSLFFCVVFR